MLNWGRLVASGDRGGATAAYALTYVDVWTIMSLMGTYHADKLPERRRNEPCCQSVLPGRLSPAQAAELAERLKAIGDATRLGMLDLLVQQVGPLCVCDLTPRFEQNQPTISHHLRILREAGLVDTVKRGLWSYYWATEAGNHLLAAVQQSFLRSTQQNRKTGDEK